jgi:putative hydrolase of the HAD superfamily
MDERHHLTFDTYEEGKLTLDQYLDRVVFNRERSFSRDEFKAFMFDQSQPLPDMIDLVKNVKLRNGLKIVAVNNEGRELSLYRIHRFQLHSFIDFFVSSCYVHLRKPDADMYHMALNMAHAGVEHSLYIDDRLLFVEVARGLGINGIHHTDHKSTRKALASFGVSL